MVKNPPTMQKMPRDPGLIPGSGRSPGEGNGNPLQYSCLENPLDREAWWDRVTWQAAVHGVAESCTQLSVHACNYFPGKRKCDSGSKADSLQNRDHSYCNSKWNIAINKLKISLGNVNIILPKKLTGDNRLRHLCTSVQNGTAFCRLK